MVIIIMTISFSVLQIVFRNMGRRIQGVQISLRAFTVSTFVSYIVVKCSVIIPEVVEPARLRTFWVVF